MTIVSRKCKQQRQSSPWQVGCIATSTDTARPFSDTERSALWQHTWLCFERNHGLRFGACPAYSNTFQHIPTYSNIFQHIPSYSNIFQHIPTCLQTGKDEMKSRRPFLWPIGSCASIMLQRETCWRPCRPAICRAWPDFLFHLAITKKTSCSPHNQETNIILTTLTLTTSIPSSTPEFLNLLLESN